MMIDRDAVIGMRYSNGENDYYTKESPGLLAVMDLEGEILHIEQAGSELRLTRRQAVGLMGLITTWANEEAR